MRGQLVETTRMRRAIGLRMTESKQQTPHLYLQTEVTVDAIREQLAQLNRISDTRVTMTTALVRALADALREHPRFNSIWTSDGLVEASDINISVAVAVPGGVLAPTLLGADHLDVLQTVSALSELVARARTGGLRPAELGSGTFTLSNLGMFDVSAFTAIITPPQVAVLAVGRPIERVVAVGNEFAATSVMTATLSADHRAIDGADAAAFLSTFKEALETFAEVSPEATTKKEVTS
jgi:pyruvate dehydrogenase E2 component (dihydrolipoamide acetyltransferase)